MKKGYEKPAIEIEDYSLTDAVAAGCTTTVSLAPEAWVYNGKSYDICEEYIQSIATENDVPSSSGAWFEGSCSCYLSSGNSTLLTS